MANEVNHAEAVHATDRLLRLRSVLQTVPVSRSTWLKGVRLGRFPKPIRLAPRAVAWRESDIQAIVRSLATTAE